MSGLSDRQIAGCFNRGLGRLHGVRLIGGAAEPFYLPGKEDRQALIRYTRDYAASALHELLTDVELRAELSRNAVEKTRGEFAWRRYVDDTLQWYDEVIQDWSSR